MADVASVIDRYFAVWNETDPARRRDLIAQTWHEEASYLDPMLAAEGPGEIHAMVGAVQEQFPGHRFRLVGNIDCHHDRVRFAWELSGPAPGPAVLAGVDFGVIADDGRLRSITGFLDRFPEPGERP